ncbi:MAG TPA: glycosyltransferase family 2 protein [Acidimicrobiia bacterium]|jgi:cellulose synthase/poly-beta-1,6-N-acetylglucosamine synthase-like glycosyltransferase|nr:glycosyltransferase family 2 protein [Acidimicrobiia bacterium]
MSRILGVVGTVVLCYFVVLQLYMLTLAAIAATALYKERMLERFGRLDDMLASDISPPVSVIVPAYNEEAGIVESVRSIAMISYPRVEVVIVNDGSRDGTLQKLIASFKLEPVPLPFRANLRTSLVRQVYHTRRPISITVVDKVNGGRADAINAGINVARYPYVMITDADVLIDGTALVKAMRHVAEDRHRTVAVGGNVRPLNGCVVKYGHIVEAKVPRTWIERWQVLEYVRSFISARPAWSAMNALPLISGAFGIFLRQAVVEVGGLTSGHMGEDMDLTMRIHRHYRKLGRPYRMVYAPSAVVWTEVPSTRAVLRRQRIRWHRGLMTAIRDFRSSFFNPRHGSIGMIGWPAMVLFEYLAPIIEAAGYIIVPLGLILGGIDPISALLLLLVALLAGALTSLAALMLDERYGYFNEPLEALKLLTMVFVENLGLRQQTVWWRIRAMIGGKSTQAWGDMQRRGVGNLDRKQSAA